MRTLLAAVFVAGGLSFATSLAQAAPITIPPLDTGIVSVSGGCGPGGFRARDGRCYARRPPPPPRYRRCPPGYRPTPYACRRIF